MDPIESDNTNDHEGDDDSPPARGKVAKAIDMIKNRIREYNENDGGLPPSDVA